MRLLRSHLIHRVAVFLICAGLLGGALPVLLQRAAAERASRTVELAVDLDGLAALGRLRATPLPDILRQMREAGAVSAVVSELTIAKLAGRGQVWVFGGKELREYGLPLLQAEPTLQEFLRAGRLTNLLTLVGTRDAVLAERVTALLRDRFPDAGVEVRPLREGKVIALTGLRQTIENAGLGLDPAEVELVRSAGLRVAPRWANFARADDAAIRATIAAAPPDTTTVIPAGATLLGFPRHLDATVREMAARGIHLALVETPQQLSHVPLPGAMEWAARSGYQAVRLTRVFMKEPADDNDRFQRWIWPVKERNIRVLYLSPYLDIADQIDVGRHLRYVAQVRQLLRQQGYLIGPAEPFRNVAVGEWNAALMALAIVAAAALLLRRLAGSGFAAGTLSMTALLGGCALILLAAATGRMTAPVVREALALAGAVTFASLSTLWALDRATDLDPSGNRLWQGTWLLLGASGISLAGAALIAGLLSDTQYLLEMRYFRGVKLALAAPLGAAAAGYWIRYGLPGLEGRPWRVQIGAFLELRLQVRHVLIISAILVAVAVYILRSGHTEIGLPVSGAETALRRILENLLWIRPRFKEFLAGYPALVVLPLLAALPRSWGLLLAGAVATSIGQASLINSFEHLRTPIEVSLLRTANGLLLGWIVGALALLAAGRALASLRPRRPDQ